MRTNFRLTLIISLLTLIMSFLQSPYTVNASTLPGGSKIATVSVEKIDDTTAKEKLETEINSWQSGEPLVLKSDYEKFLIPRTAIKFDIDATVKQLNEKTKRQMSTFFLKQRNIHIPLIAEIDYDVEEVKQLESLDYILADQTIQNILDTASELRESDITIVYDKNKEIKQEKIVEMVVPIPDGLSNSVLSYVIKELDETMIPPKSPFSMIKATEVLDSLGESTNEQSFIGSMLYSLALQTNFEIIMRETELRHPDYIDDGLYAYVNPPENIDFILNNPNEFAFKIKVKQTQDDIKMTLYSFPLEYTYEYELRDYEDIEARTIYHYNPKLFPNEQKVVQKGEKGYTADVYRKHFNENGKFVKSEFISKEFSLPVPEIIEVSTEDEADLSESEEEETELELEEVLEMSREDLLETQVELQSELDKIQNEINTIKDANEKNVKRIEEEMNKVFGELIQQFITIGDLIEAGKEDEADEEIEKVTEDFQEALETLENPVFKLFLEALLENNGKEE